MPVIVVGADTPLGDRIVDALLGSASEVRAFVSDGRAARSLRTRGVKVAVGDVSDGSHVGGAALGAFCAVLLTEAADDDRERAFASAPGQVITAWADGLRDAGTTRVIWVGDEMDEAGAVASAVDEFAAVPRGARIEDDVIADVVRIEAAAEISE